LEISSDEVLALGVGSAGSRIVTALSRESLRIDRFAYISTDKADLELAGPGEKILVECPVDQKLSPSMVRGLAIPTHRRMVDLMGAAKVVFVVAGLGGATGSGLAPIIAQIAQQSGAIAVGVAVMPFEFERKLRFYAGVSLRRLRSAARGVIVIDNDILLKSSQEKPTLKEIHRKANSEVVKALGSLLSKPSESSVTVGLNKVLSTVLQEGYSLLGVANSGTVDKTEEALAKTVISLNKIAEAREASHAVVVLAGDSSVTASDVGLAVKRLGSMMNNQAVDVEYGVSYGGRSQLCVSLLASGFKSTKYDDYDPLAKIFANNTIDNEMDTSLQSGLEFLTSCD
jgi:cell division protein FtsZ